MGKIEAAPSAALRPSAEGQSAEAGYVDFYGHAPAAGGWVFCGWAEAKWRDPSDGGSVMAVFERGRVVAEVLTCWHGRADLGRRGIGFVAFLRAGSRPLGELLGLEVNSRGVRVRILPTRPLVHLRDGELLARARALLGSGSGPARARLAGLLSRQAYTGKDTLSDLPVPVKLEVDEVVQAGPDGVVAMGWLLDPTSSIAAIRLRCGALASEPLAGRWLRSPRPDLQQVAAQLGDPEPNPGFVAYAPGCYAEGEPLYAEIELHSGEMAFKRLPPPVRRGNVAMRSVLERVTLAPDEIAPAFDRVLGPSLTAINAARLAQPRPHSVVAFGTPNPAPVCSVIVPLYGRMDFLTYQLALFSEHDMGGHELVYVLDDPPRKRELLDLAHSAHRRFGLPFRVVLSERNLGYGPANNLGLKYARGEFICYLNSDVMPRCGAWLDRMVASLRADAGLGMVGAQLLFEDGTVQHEGLTFERLPQLAGWPFPMHPGKGRLPRPDAPALQEAEGVTGACMVLRRSLAEELGGFDETYAIGDFEDSDLCMRIRARGLRCAVDRRASLWHLERQSQVTPDRMWRFYVTLLNAWTHTRRWFDRPGAGEAQAAE